MSFVSLSDLEPLVMERRGFDMSRAALGRPGCPVRSGSNVARYDTPGAVAANYSAASLDQRYDQATRVRIAGAVSSIDGVSREIETQGRGAIDAFNAFISKSTNDSNDEDWVNGIRRTKNMGDLKLLFFADMDDLILNAPDAPAASELCAKKLEVERQAAFLWKDLEKVIQKANEAQQNRAWWEQLKAWFRGIVNTVTALINAFIEAIKAAAEVARRIFSFALSVAEKALSFVFNYPRLTAGLAIGALALTAGAVGYGYYRKAKAIASVALT